MREKGLSPNHRLGLGLLVEMVQNKTVRKTEKRLKENYPNRRSQNASPQIAWKNTNNQNILIYRL